MNENINKYREFENRTTDFAKRVIRLCKELLRDVVNTKLIDQIIRSAGSVGANYREANEAPGKKDFVFRLRIARKECKETEHWLQLIEGANQSMGKMMEDLFKECSEIRNILSAIITKVSDKQSVLCLVFV